MPKIKKRALFVMEDKYLDARHILAKANIPSWNEVNVISFNLFTAVVTFAVTIGAVIGIYFLNK